MPDHPKHKAERPKPPADYTGEIVLALVVIAVLLALGQCVFNGSSYTRSRTYYPPDAAPFER